jgi:hypothetical protein
MWFDTDSLLCFGDALAHSSYVEFPIYCWLAKQAENSPLVIKKYYGFGLLIIDKTCHS